MTARFRVSERLDAASLTKPMTVMISRRRDWFAVRPPRSRRVYVLPLLTVAEMVCEKVLKSEAERRAKRRVTKKRGR